MTLKGKKKQRGSYDNGQVLFFLWGREAAVCSQLAEVNVNSLNRSKCSGDRFLTD